MIDTTCRECGADMAKQTVQAVQGPIITHYTCGSHVLHRLGEEFVQSPECKITTLEADNSRLRNGLSDASHQITIK